MTAQKLKLLNEYELFLLNNKDGKKTAITKFIKLRNNPKIRNESRTKEK